MRSSLIYCVAALLSLPSAGLAHIDFSTCTDCDEPDSARVASASIVGSADLQLGSIGSIRAVTYHQPDSAGDVTKQFNDSSFNHIPRQEDWDFFGEVTRIQQDIQYYLDSCGPGGTGDWLVPDFNFEFACEVHDQCYLRGGSAEDRMQCDRDFYEQLMAFGAPPSLAAAYYLAVRSAGWLYFRYHGDLGMSDWDAISGCAFLEICIFPIAEEFGT